MPPRRSMRQGKRQRFYARTALIAFSSEVGTGSREENASKQQSRQRYVAFGHLMHSFSADPASSHSITRFHPALISFADEVRATLARLSAYVMTLALLAILGIALCNALPDAMVTGSITTSGWSQVERPARAFAVGQANLHDKTEAYEILRHPEGGGARSRPLDRRRR